MPLLGASACLKPPVSSCSLLLCCTLKHTTAAFHTLSCGSPALQHTQGTPWSHKSTMLTKLRATGIASSPLARVWLRATMCQEQTARQLPASQVRLSCQACLAMSRLHHVTTCLSRRHL